MANSFGKFLYALLFLVVIPVLLWAWAWATAPVVRYPALDSPVTGWLLAGSGLGLMLWGMLALKQHGKGLPMNAFPPPEFVIKGPYRLFRHPIYWGFGLFIAGFFILTGSASGLWLVTPVAIMGMVALVWGYEKIDLEKRFPNTRLHTILDLPANHASPASGRDRRASAFWVLGLLLLTNFLTLYLAASPYAGEPARPSPNAYLLVWSWLVLAAVPFLLKNKDVLREWAVSCILGLALSLYLALVFPAVGAQYLPAGLSWPLSLLSVPVLLLILSLKSALRQSQRLILPMSLLALLLSMVQLAASRSAVLHLGTSLAIYGLAAYHRQVWLFLRNTAEKVANSWQEWVFGKIRVINHGFYIGVGTFSGILIAGALAGKTYAWAILVFTVIGIVFAALWAQIIEGSEKLKRPFGYYGSLVSLPFGSLVLWLMGIDAWKVIAVVAVAMPWSQAIGRLRCLVNGCCHGGPVDNPNIGIRYVHFRSRVCNISGLQGVLLHPTQLYAMIWLFFVGFVLLALWYHQLPAAFIAGMYMILTGLGRFVEEAYRGEVQTKILAGLRLYQWIAVVSVQTGMAMTVVPTEAVPHVAGMGWETLVAALLGGLFADFAMGIDFPYSNARFSRLV